MAATDPAPPPDASGVPLPPGPPGPAFHRPFPRALPPGLPPDVAAHMAKMQAQRPMQPLPRPHFQHPTAPPHIPHGDLMGARTLGAALTIVAAPPPDQTLTPMIAGPPDETVAKLLARPLFAATRRPPVPRPAPSREAAAADPPPAAPPPPDPLPRLAGIMIVGKTARFALFDAADDKGQRQRVSVHDRVGDETVLAIEADHLLLQTKNGTQHEVKPERSSADALQAMLNDRTALGAVRATRHGAPGADRAQPLKPAITLPKGRVVRFPGFGAKPQSGLPG